MNRAHNAESAITVVVQGIQEAFDHDQFMSDGQLAAHLIEEHGRKGWYPSNRMALMSAHSKAHQDELREVERVR